MSLDNEKEIESMTATLEDPTLPPPESSTAPNPSSVIQEYATTRKIGSASQFAQNKMLLLGGGAVVIVLLLFIFAAGSGKHPSTKDMLGLGAPHKASQPAADQNSNEQKSVSPIIDSANPPKNSPDGLLNEQDLEHTAKPKAARTDSPVAAPRPTANGSLGSVPPFEATSNWEAPPYQQKVVPTVPANNMNSASNNEKMERDQPSLVFVRKVSQAGTNDAAERAMSTQDSFIGLPPGASLRARLETAASTAVRTPVMAVIEYNYEQNGEIIIPAGAKAFGRIGAADTSGYVSIRFDSLLMPDGSWVPIEAQATNLSLGPLRGKVQGKNTGRNAIVRSLSGIGQVASLLVGGTGAINQPFSEGDLIREQVSANIGQSTDEELSRLALTQHIIVSIPANTPIYLVLERPTKQIPSSADGVQRSAATATNLTNNVDSLRQLLQLQRELNQSSDMAPH